MLLASVSMLRPDLEGQLLLRHTMRLDPGPLGGLAFALAVSRILAQAYMCAAACLAGPCASLRLQLRDFRRAALHATWTHSHTDILSA